MHELIAACPPGGTSYINCSRRIGKSHGLLLEAVELCLNKPNARVLYLAPQQKDALEFSSDLSVKVLENCPAHLKPEFSAQAKEFRFKNGSVIRFKGTNGEHAQFLRGGAYDLIILDECGQMDDLKHVVNDVCAPMTMTTKGKIVLASTPPRSPGHDSKAFFDQCSDAGRAITFTIIDAHDLPQFDYAARRSALVNAGEKEEHVDDILAGKLDPKTTTALREYFCVFCSDADTAVVPEFDLQARREIVKDLERPKFFDAYVAMDPGFQDRTGQLFAYVDFLQQKLVIEDEALLHKAGTPDIAKSIKDKELELWGEFKQPRVRVSDIDLRLIADLHQLHDIQFVKANKQQVRDAVALLRFFIQQRILVIHPRCQRLIRQLSNATWKSDKANEFDRTQLDGHYDLVAAAIYLVRVVDLKRNPFPPGYFGVGGPGGLPAGTWVSPRHSRKKQGAGIRNDTRLNRKLAKRK